MGDGVQEQINQALVIANHVFAARFQGASCAFAAGSIMRGEGTPSSDIDLVVVFDHLDAAWRESFIESGLPVEVFVHDPQTLTWFIENDAKNGYPIMVDMIASGVVIGPDIDRAEALKTFAVNILAKGPPPFEGEKRDGIRYLITSLLEDLRDVRSPAERRAITAQLYQPLADVALLGRCAWSGKGKWIPRLLNKLDSDLAQRFDHAFEHAAQGDTVPLQLLAENELARHGGLYFAGDKRMAPADARSSTFRIEPLEDATLSG